MKMWKILVLLLVLWQFPGTESKRRYKIKLDKMDIKYNDNYISDLIFYINKTSNTMQGSLNLIKDVTGVPKVKMTLLKQSSNKVYEQFFINVTVEICKLFKQNLVSSTMKGFVGYVISHTDIPPRCPVYKGAYHLNSIGNVEEFFPPGVPRLNYRLDCVLYELKNKKSFTLMQYQIYANITNYK